MPGGSDDGSQEEPSTLSYSLGRVIEAHPGGEQSCRAVAFAWDGATVFTGSSDKSVCAYNPETGKLVRGWRLFC